MVVGDNKSIATRIAGKSLAISIAMAMQRYDVGCITRSSTSRISLEATGCCHLSSACTILPRWPPWLKNSFMKHTNTNKKLLLASNYSKFRSLVA